VFTPGWREETTMQNKVLESQVSEINERLEGIDRLIAANTSAAATAEARLEQVKKRLAALTATKEETRVARGKAAAAGEDTAELGRQLKKVDEERELREDEIVGLSACIEQLASEGTLLKKTRLAEARKIPMAKLRAAAWRYNALAEQLAPVLEDLRQLRAELGEPPEGLVVQFPGGVLKAIPRAFPIGEAGFEDSGDPEKHFFFNAPDEEREKRGRRVRPLTMAAMPS
jgi:chromosome segregation ATPase